MLMVYNGCLAVGVVVLVVSTLGGHLLNGIGNTFDMSLDMDIDADSSGFLHISILGCMVAAATFGLTGRTLHMLGFGAVVTLITSAVIGLLSYWGVSKALMCLARGSTTASGAGYLVGQKVGVLNTIQENGIGEIVGEDSTKSSVAYLAKSEDGQRIKTGAIVLVDGYVEENGVTYMIVSQIPTDNVYTSESLIEGSETTESATKAPET